MAETPALLVVILGQVGMMAVVPLSGRLSDRLGHRPMWWVSLVGLFVPAVPAYLLIAQSFALALVGFGVLGLLFVPETARCSIRGRGLPGVDNECPPYDRELERQPA